MDPAYKDAIQVVAWLAAALSAAIGAFQLRQSRIWRRTELAKQTVEEIWADSKCKDAMTMVDWSNREYVLDSGENVRITKDEVRAALRTPAKDAIFSKKEVFIRDCFDSLLDALQQIEHYAKSNLIQFKDVEYPLEYTVVELCAFREELKNYVSAYGMHGAGDFLERYPCWADVRQVGRNPCIEEETSPAFGR